MQLKCTKVTLEIKAKDRFITLYLKAEKPAKWYGAERGLEGIEMRRKLSKNASSAMVAKENFNPKMSNV